MKVVLFCGGLGTRLREYSDTIPKPMVNIGYRPILWHIMKYYAHYGHRDFILCLGHYGDLIRQYFLTYDECISNDFVLSDGGRNVELYSRDLDDWRITFVDTGLNANIGQRLRAVEKYVASEELFLANYSDGLSDLPLPAYLAYVRAQDKIASFVAVRPNQSLHVVTLEANGLVSNLQSARESSLLINGGFFAFKSAIFDHIADGEELVEAPFRRLIEKSELTAYRYEGFWAPMDTLKDKQQFDAMELRGDTPWAVWKAEVGGGPRAGAWPGRPAPPVPAPDQSPSRLTRARHA